MAYDYNKVKEQYERMDSQQKQQFADMMKWNGNYADFMSRYNAEKTPTASTTPTTPTKTTASTTSNQNTWLNSMSSQVAQNNSRNFQVGTWDVAEMPQQPKTQSVQTSNDRLAKARWNLTYEQQQERLNRTAWLKDALANKGITSKTQPTTQPTQSTQQRTSTVPTAKQAQWDYQDNSQARMNQIADNLNNYKQTMPRLFDDASAFYSFFIDWNNRSQEQIDFLWDYFNKAQKFWKYDNLSPDAIWTWIANGTIPEDYLNNLKSTDPQKYQEVMAAKQNREDAIKNESFLNDAANMAWIEWWESEPSSIQYGKWNWIWMDEDSNWVDDRRENYASEEEKGYQKQISDLNAANLDIDNTVKHTYDDLVKKYPWATKATLMAMAQDRNSDLLREKENNLVELTRLQGYVWYMQAERQEMNKAGAESINQLRQNLSDYYKFSPQWIAELAQSQYAATNITLDQADTWTETQQQMALEAAITPIFDKYWDIIERSPAEVINDTIAYAKKNWVWLRQALEESFTKYLKEKPAYKAMQTAMTNSWWDIKNVYVDWEQQSVWYNPQTWETKPLWYSYNSSTGKYDPTSINNFWEWDYQQNRWNVQKAMREWATEWWNLEWAAQNIAANMEWQYLWLNTCGYYVNDYIYWVTWEKWPFGSEIANKRAACNNKNWLVWAKVWDAIVFDWTIAWWVNWVLPEYWHVGIITAKYPDWSIDVSSSISWKVQTRTIKPWDAWYKNIYGTRSLKYSSWASQYWYWENPMSNQIESMRAEWDLNADQKKDLLFASQSYWIMYDLASNWDIEHLLRSSDWQKFLANLRNSKFVKNWDDATWWQVMDAMRSWITDQRNLKTVNDLISVIELKLRKTSWAAIAASEWVSNFDMLLPWVNQDYEVWKHKYERFENTYLREYFNSAWAWIKWYKYIPLFSPNSPYYKSWNDNQTQSSWTTAKWTWNISWTTWQWTVVWTSSPYSSLFNQLNLG